MQTKSNISKALFSVILSCSLFFYLLHFNFNSTLLTTFLSFSASCLTALFFYFLTSSFKAATLKQLNTVTIGLFFGCLLANAFTTAFSGIGSLIPINSVYMTHSFELIKIILYLSGLYMGIVFTYKQAENFSLAIPFISLLEKKEEKSKLILDQAIINDSRFIDLCNTGLFPIDLVIPKFLIEKIYAETESGDEKTKIIARKSLENINQLENLDCINILIDSTKVKNTLNTEKRMLQLAEKNKANILTSQDNYSEVYQNPVNIKVISLQQITTILKPSVPTGETVNIKVQRYGKEARQGVGYLDDGTMVVINNGGDFIGETIDAQVISVKQTSAGRIIFTNAVMSQEDDPITNSIMYD